jgi:hypothetical protein
MAEITKFVYLIIVFVFLFLVVTDVTGKQILYFLKLSYLCVKRKTVLFTSILYKITHLFH